MRVIGRRLVVLALGLVLALVLVEVVLRVVHVPAIEIHRRAPAHAERAEFFDYDPELGWRGRARAHGAFAGWEFTSDVRLNARGFRDAEVAETKAGHAFRIVLLGDSITWGHGVDQAQRYGDVLAQALRRRGITAEVANLAVSGYGTDQELLLWEREGRRYCADLVLLGLYENDLRENVLAFQGRHPKPYFRLAGDGALSVENVPVPRVTESPVTPSRNGLRTWLRRHLRIWAALAYVRQTFRGGDASPPARPEAPPGSVELTAALIRRLAASVIGEGSAFGVVVLPDLYYSPTTMQAASRSGVAPVLDLTPVFRGAAAAGGPLFHRLDGAHWTARAHGLGAEAIARWILAGPVLPRSPRACAGAS
jgi:lysophospholipase L1-like esterase